MLSHKFSVGLIEDGQSGFFHLNADDSYFHFTNSTEKEVAEQACNERGYMLQHAIESKLGRKLTTHEGIAGLIARPDRRTTIQKMDQEAKWRDIFNPPQKNQDQDANPYLSQIKALEEARAKKEDPEKFELQQKANAWETAQAEARVQAARDADPARQDVVSQIRSQLTAARFDPRSNVGDLVDLENQLKLAQNGDFRQAASITNAWRKDYGARLKAMAQPAVAKALANEKEVIEMQKPLALPVQSQSQS